MKRSARFFLALNLSFFLSVSIFAQTISSRVSQNSDDAEEVVLTGNTDISSTDLELTQSGLTDQIVGLRFQDIQVPVGAHILSAYIEFETDELTNIDPCDITLYGQATDNPGTFTSTGGDISSRPHTTASVLWSPDAWNTVDEKHQTSDISTIIQEIVNRSGWSPGNSMVFTLEGTGQRVAESYEGEADAAALLVINYTLITNDPPDTPVLVTPADDATSIPDSPNLEVTVSDPESDLMNVTFYGRPVDETPPAEDFTIVGLPDTQYYSDDSPDTYFIGQTSWIVANKDILNIAFVAHEGDIVHNSASTDQYINADAAMSVLENPVTTGLPDGIPYGIIPGNHDLPTTNYNTYFGISRFSGRSYYGGYYGSNNDNNYSLFTAGGIDFIVLNLEFQPGTAVLDWADALLKANTDRQGIVVTHSILNANNSWSYEYVYSELQDNPNLFLMLCGHMHTTTDGAAIRIETGSGGNTIYILMADYQDFSNGGNGYLRTMRFSPATNRIYVETYSPALDAYLTDSENQFELDYVMDASPGFEEIGSAPGISSGTNASVIWPGLDFETEYEWYAEVSDGTASTSSSIWSFTTTEASSLEVTSPNGTENWTAETSHPITWTSDNTSGNVKIEYSTDNGSSWKEIIDIFADEGSYDWLVPDDPSTTCLLQISDIDNEPSDISDATFTITGVNDAPLVSDIPDQSVAEGTSFAPIILDDFVEDEETPDIDISWTYAGNIELAIDITDRIATIAPPDENWNGSETITFTASDDDGTPLSDSDDAIFTISAVNDAPVVSDIPDQEIAEGNDFTTIALDDFVNDVETADADIIWSYSGNSDLTVSVDSRIATITLPDENWNGSEIITFTATDDDGTPLSGSDDVLFTVTAVNDAPIVSDISDQEVVEGNAFATIALDDFVEDIETADENITWSYSGNTDLIVSIDNRVATITPPNENWNGSETITFTASDDDATPLSDSDDAIFTITGVNDAPIVSDIPDQEIFEGNSFAAINLDDYVDDPETDDIDISWSFAGNTELTVDITDRVATITPPDENWIGSETITFTATDDDGTPLSNSDDALFTITEMNDSPIVSDIPNQEINEGESFTTIALDDYVEDEETADIDISWTYAGNIELAIDITDRIATITPPDENWNGSETITFTATDDDGTPLSDSDDAIFTITAVNDAPVVADIPDQEITEGNAFIAIHLDDYVEDPETDDVDISWTYAGNIELTIDITDRIATITPPDENWNGSETIAFTATDDDGTPLSDSDDASFTVTAVNDAPVVSDIPDQEVAEGNAFVAIHLDDYVDDPETDDVDISWTYAGNTDLVIDITDRIATITPPDENWNGSETITFTATDDDGTPLSDSDDASFTVTAVNDPPVISEIDDQLVAEGSSFTTIVLDNYVQDNETVDENITWTVIGEVNLNISILDRIATIIPENENWNGSETIIFIATDDDAFPLSDVEEVTFTVTAVNDAPTVSDIPDQIISEGYTFATIVLDDYVDDPETADPDITWTVSGATDLTITILDRVATIETPDLNWIGSETLTFIATDNDAIPLSGTDNAVFTVTYNSIEQSIDLQEGWNIFSLYVTSDLVSLREIVQPLIDEGSLVKIQDEEGAAIEYVDVVDLWIDNIGDWSNAEGYKIRVNVNTSLDVNGAQIMLPLTIDLAGGWNIISYPVSAPQNAFAALNELIVADNLTKVQNETGAAIEYVDVVGLWIDNIGDFLPGEGYKIRVDLEDALSFYDVGKKYSDNPYSIQNTGTRHYTSCWQGNGLDHMNVYLELSNSNLNTGDEIGIFDGELCVGRGIIGDPNLNLLSLVASADDPVTEKIDGFKEGNPLSLRVWDANSWKEYPLNALEYRSGKECKFEPMGTAIIQVKSSLTDLVYAEGLKTSLDNIYPNPFSQATTLPFVIARETNVEIAIYDILGQRIDRIENSIYKPGSYTIEWNAHDNNEIGMNPGIYFVKMVADGQVFIKPVELIRK